MIKKWSYSRWSTYNKCPASYEWTYKFKKPRTTSPALDRGLDIHKKAENYVNGIIKSMPKELLKFESEFKYLKRDYKKGNGKTEPDISVNLNGSQATMRTTDYFIGFGDYLSFSDNCIDCIDYKTGRMYPEHRDQGHAYSTSLLTLNPKIETVNVEFWYLDKGDVTEFNYSQSDLPRMKRLWANRIDKMYADTKFKNTPHKFCGWCNRHVKNGGDCKG